MSTNQPVASPSGSAPRPFRRLQWRLTFSYMVVTVGTTLLIEVAVMALLAWYLFASQAFLCFSAAEAVKESGKAAPLVTGTGTDPGALRRWARKQVADSDGGNELRVELALRLNAEVFAVMDNAGRVLAATPEGGPVREGDTFRAESLPLDERAAFLAARSGDTMPARLALRNARGCLVIATPVRGADGRQIGATFYRSYPPFAERSSPLRFLAILFPTALTVAAFSGVAGSVFGHYTARGLTRRLEKIASASDAWAAGELAARADVGRDGDELSLLAERLNRMAAQLDGLMAVRQELATLEERNRLARELHDTVKQQVFAAGMQLGAAAELVTRNPEAARGRLMDARKLTGDAQQELTALLQELRGGERGARSLPEMLKEYAAEWAWRTGIAAEVRVEAADAFPALSPTVSQALYRIAQEALANVARHSGASRVVVTLATEAGAVTLTVADDGRGMPEATGGAGMGLGNMRERAESLPGGRFGVRETEGGGVTVCVSAAG